jgi:hypothetical protein
MKALDENWNSTNSVQFTTKHVILIAIVNAHSSYLMRDVAKAFSIHHGNVFVVISRCKVMDDNGFAL